MTKLLKSHLIGFQQDVHRTAIEKGWWPHKTKKWWQFWIKERNQSELISLMHSELSEALEALRLGNPPDDKIPQYSGVEAELADVIIRILDFAEAYEYEVIDAMIAKNLMNKTRAYKHGGKRF